MNGSIQEVTVPTPNEAEPARLSSHEKDLFEQEKAPLERHDTNVTDQTQVEVSPENAPKDSEIEFPDGGLQAWLNVVGALCITTSTFGVVNSWVFQAYYSDELLPNVSPSSLSWIGSIQYALTFFPSLFTGRMFDLGHFRIPMLISSILLITSTFLIAECTQYWHFLLCQGFALGLSTGALFGPALSCVAHWFKRRRSTAYGVVACGSSIGGTLFPIAIRNLIPLVGFRWTLRILGFILLAIVGIGNLTLRRRLPAVKVSGGLFNLRVFKHLPFSVYAAAGFFCFLGLYTVLTYIDSSATFYGVSPDVSFYMVSVANAASAIGRIWTGVLSDRVGPLNMMIPATAAAAMMTYAWPYARTTPSVIVIAILYGCSSGAFVGLLAMPVVNMGETNDVGRRQGMLFSLLAVGAILGPPISGQINTATHGFVAVGFYAGSMVLVGVLLIMVSRALLLGRVFGGKA